MKTALTTLVILSFAGIAVFGILAMGHNEFNHKGCIAAVSKGLSCMENGFASFLFHANVFKSFSMLILNAVFAVFLLAISSFVLKTSFLVPQNFSFGFVNQQFSENLYSHREKLRNWLSLHENSPSLN